VALATVFVVFSLLFAPSAAALDETYDLPSDDSTVVGSVGFIDASRVGAFWSAARGDLVSETFSTSLASINRAVLNVEVVTNVLHAGWSVDWDLEINGVVVDSFSVFNGFTGPVTIDVSFTPIAGPNYTVVLRVTNEVAAGSGAISLAYANPYAHSIQMFSATVTVQVDIDIKPGSDPNSINLGSRGRVPVAVLTTSTFDATTVDPDSVQFAGAAPVRWALEDVDGDGDTDLVFHFKTQELNLDGSSTVATLAGQTSGGQPILGTAAVNIVP
jgi:hypothetical protein